MSIAYKGQRWVLLGTAPASQEAFGLKPIEFPCGYSMPYIAYADGEKPMEFPNAEGDVWALAGFAMEVGKNGKDIPEAKAKEHIAGYRPWLCLYYPIVRDELKRKEHTITIWDQGVCLFYGLWREAGQALGDLIPAAQFEALAAQPVALILDGKAQQGDNATAYAHKGPKIVDFMTRFMTLSTGDVYVMGPLVAQKVAPGTKSIGMSVGDLTFEKAVIACP